MASRKLINNTVIKQHVVMVRQVLNNHFDPKHSLMINSIHTERQIDKASYAVIQEKRKSANPKEQFSKQLIVSLVLVTGRLFKNQSQLML